jgi:hypothetical protein
MGDYFMWMRENYHLELFNVTDRRYGSREVRLNKIYLASKGARRLFLPLLF